MTAKLFFIFKIKGFYFPKFKESFSKFLHLARSSPRGSAHSLVTEAHLTQIKIYFKTIFTIQMPKKVI